jgi:hypothetical protein
MMMARDMSPRFERTPLDAARARICPRLESVAMRTRNEENGEKMVTYERDPSGTREPEGKDAKERQPR